MNVNNVSHGHNDQANGDIDVSHRDQRAPDEYTRLLPNRLDSDATPRYLSPDDPAVTPYNLWSVRLMRWVTVIFTMLSFMWWVLQLVSIFVTPPGLQTRGSVFFAFGYATMSLGLLAVTLLFFAVPSKSVRILSGVLAGLLLADTIIILAVRQLRHEEAFVGSTSVICMLPDDLIQHLRSGMRLIVAQGPFSWRRGLLPQTTPSNGVRGRKKSV